jgi:hypothetical protein
MTSKSTQSIFATIFMAAVLFIGGVSIASAKSEDRGSDDSMEMENESDHEDSKMDRRGSDRKEDSKDSEGEKEEHKGKFEDKMKEVKLTDEQKVAIKTARDLMKEGKFDEAKKVLEAAKVPMPAMPAHPILKNELTAEQKAALVKAKELRTAGDTEGAKAALSAVGLPTTPEEMKAAVEARKAEIKSVREQAKEMRKSGDREGAKTLLQEHGIRPGFWGRLFGSK